MASNFASNPCRSIGFKTSTSSDVAYTIGQASFLVNIRVANVVGSTANVTIKWSSTEDSTEYTLIDAQPVPANSYSVYEFEAFALKKDDEIKISGSVDNAFHCVITAVELIGRSI